MSNRLPTWAPRVPKKKIRQFYENDAKGIYDDELIDDLGYALLARCESFLAANHAWHGEVPCPECITLVPIEEILRCSCGWQLPWEEYFGTIQHKQLSGGEEVLEPFRDFVKRFPRARTLRKKTLLIDQLIHRFHWNGKRGCYSRPVVVNLIEGRMSTVMALLDELAYSENSTPRTRENQAKWRNIVQEDRDRMQKPDSIDAE